MEAGFCLHICNGQFLAVLKRIDRLVFGAMVHEDAVDVVHTRYETDVAGEDTEPNDDIHEAKLPRCPVRRIANGFDEQLWEDFEQPNCHKQTCNHRAADSHIGCLGSGWGRRCLFTVGGSGFGYFRCPKEGFGPKGHRVD